MSLEQRLLPQPEQLLSSFVDRGKRLDVYGINPKITDFLTSCYDQNILAQVPRHMSVDQWADHLTATYSYYFMPDLSLQDIADTYGVVKQNIDARIKKTIRKLWRRSPAEIRALWPEGELASTNSQAKDRKLISTVDHFRKLVDLLNEGESYETAYEHLGWNHQQIIGLRSVVRQYGIDIADVTRYLSQAKAQRLHDMLLEETDSERAEKLLEKVTDTFLRNEFVKDNPALVGLLSFAKTFGGNRRNLSSYKSCLESSQVPVGIIQYESKKQTHLYYFISMPFLEQAQTILEDTFGVSTKPSTRVVQLTGESIKQLPTYAQLHSNEKYGSVAFLLRALGFPPNTKQGQTILDVVGRDCPIAIFQYGKTFRYDLKDENAFIEFLKRRP